MQRLHFYLRNEKVIKNHLYIWESQIFTRNYTDDLAKNNKDLYDVLGLKSSATSSEIKKAYYDLTFKYHPDKNEGNTDASTKFREVSEAYEVLGNYGLKKRYDKGLPLPLIKNKSVVTRGVVIEKEVKYQKFYDSRTSAPKFGKQYETIEEGKSETNRNYENHQKRINEEFEKSKSLQVPVMIFITVMTFLSYWSSK